MNLSALCSMAQRDSSSCPWVGERAQVEVGYSCVDLLVVLLLDSPLGSGEDDVGR